MSELSPADLIRHMKAAHGRERSLISGLTDEQAHAAAGLPGWTRGHVLAARLVFVRAASRQIRCALAGERTEFFDGGRPGRDVEIEAHADRRAAELAAEVLQAVRALEENWLRVGPLGWGRPVIYRGPGTLTDILLASWREAEIHCVDLELGARPSAWSAEFCEHLFEFLAPRVPDGVQIELATPGGELWTLGAGERIGVCGARTDLAAWLAGRRPVNPVESSTGMLPELRGLGAARSAR